MLMTRPRVVLLALGVLLVAVSLTTVLVLAGHGSASAPVQQPRRYADYLTGGDGADPATVAENQRMAEQCAKPVAERTGAWFCYRR